MAIKTKTAENPSKPKLTPPAVPRSKPQELSPAKIASKPKALTPAMDASEPMVTVPCTKCGTTFEPTASQYARYDWRCSKCRKEARERRYRERLRRVGGLTTDD